MAQSCWKCGAPTPSSPFWVDPSPATTVNSLDFTRLRTGNDVPLDSEIPFICDMISEGQDQLDDLEIQIRNLEAALAKLIQRRDEIAEHVRQHRVILNPIRRFPPELLCEIFALTLCDVSGEDEIPDQPPWYLGQICRSWRLSALAYPNLWTSIIIPPSSIPCSMVKAQLHRSANAPLKVYWAVNENGRTIDPQLADIIAAQCSRWAFLRLDIFRSSDVLNWLLPVSGRLTSLKRLEVLHAPGEVIPDFLSSAPSLSEVVLTDWQFGFYSPKIRIPWGQITHYRGAYEGSSQLAILKAAPNLLQCSISFEHFDDVDPSSIIVLPHLRRLCMEMPQFLVHISAPSLEELYSPSHSRL
ncbi:F-box domain-containing protein [Mycena venus]|uniref:F-box domain-containing protein n=1 Tax=Mycena venus TaxID=2733690 RepID=A0A8H6X6Y0_9AGAR|nr:F-box domain-containing protein [Mycena venus]